MKYFLIILLILIVGCVQEAHDYDAATGATYRPPDVIELDKVEVLEYEGVNLDSINNFRENSIKGPQYVNISEYELEIISINETTLTYDQVLENQKYSKVVTLYCVEGWDVTILWEGILLKDLIEEVPEGANTVIFYAYDGYSTSLPLDYVLDNDIILAYKMNNVTLPPERGFPFQLVAQDKYGYKWVKWLTKIELSADSNYKGYWETRGYNQKADVGGPVRG